MDYQIVRDSREQTGWHYDNCVVAALKTGDYSIKGHEDTIIVERKASVAELAKNVLEDRFERELERLSVFKHAFIVCEFTLEEVFGYPYSTSLPASVKRKIRIRGSFLFKKITEWQIKYRVHFIFAGTSAKSYVKSLFNTFLQAQQGEEATS